jgi:hypothetical protein
MNSEALSSTMSGHRSEGVTITLSMDDGGTPETFLVSLYACEELGGAVKSTNLFIDRKLESGCYQDNMMMSTAHAQKLATVLMTVAELAAAR